MKRYLKTFDTFICFDTEEKTITTVTITSSIDNKSMVYTKDDGGFDVIYNSALRNLGGNGSPGPVTNGWAETTEEVFNQVKEDVKSFFLNI